MEWSGKTAILRKSKDHTASIGIISQKYNHISKAKLPETKAEQQLHFPSEGA